MNRFFFLRLFVATMSCAGLAACGSGSGIDAGQNGSVESGKAAVPYPPKPDSDPFYAQPSPMPDVAPGTILNSRKVTFAPALSAPMPNAAWQLKFMSKDVNDQPIAAVATVVMPLVPALVGAAPLVSYQFAEDSLGMQCAPSRTLTGGTANYNSQAETLEYLPGLTAQGWTMVFPDHEGPYSSYAVGKLAGQISLDAIRAAESFAPLGLAGKQTPVGLWGYSGGALATAWAAALQATYAPELNVVGVASGGTPADLISVAKAFDSGLGNVAFFSLGFSGVIGATRSYPELLPPSILNDKGKAAVAALANGCVGNTGDGSPQPMGHFADYTNTDAFETPGVKATASKIALPQAGHVPIAKMYLYHSQIDELIPIAGTDALVKSWCDSGVHISYYRAVTGEHVALAATGAPDAILYLASTFAGATAPVVPLLATTCN